MHVFITPTEIRYILLKNNKETNKRFVTAGGWLWNMDGEPQDA